MASICIDTSPQGRLSPGTSLDSPTVSARTVGSPVQHRAGHELGDASMKETDLTGIVAEHIDAINAGDTDRNPQLLLLGEALLRHSDLLVSPVPKESWVGRP
jgi:hypothetical protein